MRLWIDTDVGDNPDDAVALVCAAAHPDTELVGVSTCGGRSEWRAAIARELVQCRVVHGAVVDDLVDAFTIAEPEALLAIGPLTNVAALLALGIELPATTVMGGVVTPVRHRGRVQRVEHNFGADPGAAQVVVSSTDATIVPLDVTVGMRLDDEQTDRLVHADERLRAEVERWRAHADFPVVLHDPLAFLTCAGDPVVGTVNRTLAVDPRGRLSAVTKPRSGREHAVVVDVDAPAAIDRVLGLVG